MVYMGSKNRISKHILPIMLAHRETGQHWIEPFVGGANMIDKVTGPRIGADVHYYLIKLLTAVQRGYVPPATITREAYHMIKANPKDYAPELVGFVGFACSFGGRWFGGYASNSDGRNYAATGQRVLIKQAPRIKDILFLCCDYQQLVIPRSSIIYCDPPYADTTGYGGTNAFDHATFYSWCAQQARCGHTVFISGSSAPDDFVCVWETTKISTLDQNFGRLHTERLFMHESQYRHIVEQRKV